MNDELNELNFSDKLDSMNKYEVNFIRHERNKYLHVSLTGSGMDFYMSSDVDTGRLDMSSEHGPALDEIQDSAVEELQEIVDAYTELIKAYMIRYDQKIGDYVKKAKSEK